MPPPAAPEALAEPEPSPAQALSRVAKAAAGGTIAVVEDGDIINIDIPNGKLELAVSDEEIARRKAALKPFKSNVTGYLKKYALHVSSAAQGAIEVFED